MIFFLMSLATFSVSFGNNVHCFHFMCNFTISQLTSCSPPDKAHLSVHHELDSTHTTISREPALIEKGIGIATKVQGLIVSWWELIVRWLEGDVHTLLSCKDKSWSMRRVLIGPSYWHQVNLYNDAFAGQLNSGGHIKLLCCTP